MSGYNPFFTHQYQAQPQNRSTESLVPSNATELPTGANTPPEGSNMTSGHTLNEMISSCNSDMQRQRRSLQSIYPVTDQGPQTNRASLMTFDSAGDGNMSAYQFSPPQAQRAAAGSVPGSLFSSGEDMQVEQLHQSRGSVNSNGRFSNIESNYGTSSFRHPINPASSFGYDVVTTYTSPTGGGFDPGISSQIAPAESSSINLFPLPTYTPVAQGSIPGAFPRHNSQDFRFPSGVMDQQEWLGGVSTLAPPQQSSCLIAAPLPVSSKSSAAYIPAEIVASSEPKPGAGKVASQYLNAYSSSGFDMFGILARVATRQNPEIDIGAVDMSCAFILCDITIYDDPIVYVSEAFERLTGYTKHEILGRNCRFLQSPDGNVDAGVKRKWVDNQTVFRLKSKLQARSEVQVSLINYRKGGQSFMNLLTMIPVRWESEEYKFSVGFQVDLVEKPQAVTKRNADGSYAINYQRDHLPRYVLHAPDQPRGLPRLISHDAVSAVLTAIGSGGTQISRSYLDKVLLENTDDVIHVLSLKGLFLYLSPSGHRLLEYDANELVGNALSSVCHPSDIVPVIRELKQSMPGTSISVAYRIRRKYSGYMWFECLGSLHIDPGKGRKCLILVGRERPVYALGKTAILETGGIGENDLWSKMSISGMFLFVSSNVRALLDRQPGELFGKNIHEFMRDESRGELGKALDVTRTGRQATFKHELRHKRGHVLQAQTRLYPGDSKPGSKPSFLVAQTRLLKSSRSNFLPSSTPAVLSSEGDLSAGFATPATSGSGGSSSTMEQQRDVSSTTLSSQSLDSSMESGPPLGDQENTLLSEDNIFEELEGTRSSNWQFELRQLERRNRLLAEELQGLLSRRKKRKRKKGPFEKACATCNSRNTPEWRRGPSGNRDLCNSCGLRWAKQTGRISPRKNSDYSDKNSTPSPAKTTDDKPQESNKATLHVGDNVSYSNRLAE